MKKRNRAVGTLLSAALLFVGVFAPGTAQAIPPFEEAVIVADEVNMRLRPTVDSPFVLKLENGTRVGVFCEEGDGWYRIIYGNYRGYVSKDYVFLPSTDTLVGNVLADETPVYQNPGDYAEAVGYVNAGTGVTITSIQGDYYAIEYMDETAPGETEAQDTPAAPQEEAPSASPPAVPSGTVGTVATEAILGTTLAIGAPIAARAEPPAEQAGTPALPEEPSAQPQETASAQPDEGETAQGEEDIPMKRGYIRKDAVKLSASKNAANLIKEGMKGVEVVKMQQELKKRGFLGASATGEFGTQTKAAVTLFQEMAGLPADGIAGEKTLAMLYGDNDIKCTYAQRMGVYGEVQLMPWSEAQNYYSRGARAKITDVRTGISWYEERMGGWEHADSEPCTPEDTAKMKQAYGGSWSWDRRAIWVTVDGVTIAASMNGMPHLGSTLDNNFPGHHCIHFYKSKVHETNAPCPRHQAQIQYAYKMGQEL